MKCAVHTEVEAAGYCRNCGKALCHDCVRPVQGALYCETCLAAMMSGASYVPAPVSSGHNPGLAAFFGIVPGLGAVYNGDYNRALLHVGIWAGLFGLGISGAAGNFEPLIWVAFGVFPLFTAVDSFRAAKALVPAANVAPAPGGPPEPPAANFVPAANFSQASAAAPPTPAPVSAGARHAPVGALILIALGVLFLLNTTGLLHEDIFYQGWPLILIGLGGWMIWKRTRGVRP